VRSTGTGPGRSAGKVENVAAIQRLGRAAADIQCCPCRYDGGTVAVQSTAAPGEVIRDRQDARAIDHATVHLKIRRRAHVDTEVERSSTHKEQAIAGEQTAGTHIKLPTVEVHQAAAQSHEGAGTGATANKHDA